MLHNWLLISTTTLILTVLFCTGLMWVIRGNSRPKLWLAIILTVVFVYIVSITIISSFHHSFLEKLMFSYSLIGIIITGLVLIYCRSLIFPWKSNRKTISRLLYGVFAYILLYIVVAVLCSPLPKLFTFEHIFETLKHPLVILRIVSFLIFVLFFIFVCIQMVSMYFRHKTDIAEQFSFRENISLSWLPYLLAFFILYGISSIFDMLVIDINWLFITINFIFAGFYMTMCFLGLRQQDIYTKLEIDQNKSETVTATNISAEMRNRLTRKLIELMQEKREYRNPELRLDGVAQALHTNRTYLSTIIRDNFDDNFIGLVNKYRIEEAKELLSGDNALSMAEISERVGFKSISSFNLFFKNDTGVSPTQFRKKQ